MGQVSLLRLLAFLAVLIMHCWLNVRLPSVQALEGHLALAQAAHMECCLTVLHACAVQALKGNPELAPAAHGGKPPVEGVRVVRDAASNIGKGFAFVLLRTKVR